jgi:hypothetical protein
MGVERQPSNPSPVELMSNAREPLVCFSVDSTLTPRDLILILTSHDIQNTYAKSRKRPYNETGHCNIIQPFTVLQAHD